MEKAKNIFELQTSHEEYSSYSFVEKTKLFNDFNHNWYYGKDPIKTGYPLFISIF